MKETKLWEIVPDDNEGLRINKIESVSETETEEQLEEVITIIGDVRAERSQLYVWSIGDVFD